MRTTGLVGVGRGRQHIPSCTIMQLMQGTHRVCALRALVPGNCPGLWFPSGHDIKHISAIGARTSPAGQAMAGPLCKIIEKCLPKFIVQLTALAIHRSSIRDYPEHMVLATLRAIQ